MNDSNTPINKGDLSLVEDIKLPEQIDVHDISFPVNVINKADGTVLGVATLYKGVVTAFKKGDHDFKIRPRYDLGLHRPDLANHLALQLDGLYGANTKGTAKVRTNAGIVELPEGTKVVWTVELFDFEGERFYERTILGGVAINQVLTSMRWFGTIVVTAKAAGYYGETTAIKINNQRLDMLITNGTLGGLVLPEWAMGL
jgi:hypothetical protein